MVWIIIIIGIMGFIIGFDILLYIIFGFFLIGIIYNIVTRDQKRKAEVSKKLEIAKIEQEERETLEKKKAIYNMLREEITEEYGYPDKEISLEQDDINQEILVFRNARRILLLGEDIAFEDILNCTITNKGRQCYSITINVNNLSNPIIQIDLWSDLDKVNEIVGLMNIVISMKKN